MTEQDGKDSKIIRLFPAKGGWAPDEPPRGEIANPGGGPPMLSARKSSACWARSSLRRRRQRKDPRRLSRDIATPFSARSATSTPSA